MHAQDFHLRHIEFSQDASKILKDSGDLLTTSSPNYEMGNEQSIALCVIFNYNYQMWERFQKHLEVVMNLLMRISCPHFVFHLSECGVLAMDMFGF